MSKKKTLEKVRQLFESRGFTLLSTEYVDSKSPLEYICSNGHLSKIGYGSLQGGHGCSKCSNNKKKTINEVELAFRQRGYTLLSTEYISSKSHLEYICSNGHQTKISFNKLQCERSCGFCSDKKKTISEVRLAFSRRGYTLLSTKYDSNKLPLLYICDQNHNAKISFANLQRGNGCPSCAEYGFNPGKPAILYYLRFQFEGNFYYKIGITNRTTSKRFQDERTPYTVIKETHYTLGKNAYDQEQEILKKFNKHRYKGRPFLTSRGDTELFIRDVLYVDDSVLATC